MTDEFKYVNHVFVLYTLKLRWMTVKLSMYLKIDTEDWFKRTSAKTKSRKHTVIWEMCSTTDWEIVAAKTDAKQRWILKCTEEKQSKWTVMFRLQTKIHRLICMQTPVYNQQLNKPSIPNVLCATDPIWVSEDWVSSLTNPLKTHLGRSGHP